MKQKRLIERLENLTIGDKVVSYYAYDNRRNPLECVVTKIGKKYIHIKGHYYESKVQKETFSGDYGLNIFPGDLNEYNHYLETIELRKKLLKLLEKEVNNLTENEILLIENIIKGN